MRKWCCLFLLSIGFAASGFSQCQVYNGQGNASANPVWVSCSGGSYTVFIQSPNNFGALTIDWGDGSPLTVVASLVPPAFISHTYAAAIANYTVIINETATACSITGLVVMEEPVNASIQIPIGGVTQTCAPADLIFSNSSTDVSSNTTFVWDFGDGSPTETYGPANAGQIVSHTYERNTVNCVTQVTLAAENYCSFGNPTTASFNPIQIYDLDEAQITASNMLLCYPDTVVHFANTTAKNCVPQGNTNQRFEYWNFGNYWGTGSDSIIDWQPFDPPARPGYDIAFPGIGTYTIMMADSNRCGADTTFITVQVTDAPTANFSMSTDSSCTGDPVSFTRLSTGGNQHRINYGNGGGFQNFGATSNRTYNTAGTYTVTVVANITGGSASCTDTMRQDIVILPSPTATANITPTGGCDSVSAAFTNSSSGGVNYYWNFGNGDTSILQNPAPVVFTTTGQHVVTLTVSSNNGCVDMTTASVQVYDTPDADFNALNVCEDVQAAFIDASTVGYGGPINSWNWSFGDPLSSTSGAQNPMFTYVDSGTYVITLIASTSFCSDTILDTILVEPRPTAIFQESDSNGCSPMAVTFINQSIFGTTYQWEFGDGNTSNLPNPVHTYIHNSQTDTFFIVKLRTFSAFGCSDSITDTIVIRGNPIADFSSNAVLDCAPLQVQFTDLSTGAVGWNWDFDDGFGSNAQNPGHTFQNQTPFISNYNVRLAVTAPNGCTDTATDGVTVYPEPLFNFSLVPDSGCSPLAVQFPVAVGAVVYDWDFGDGGTSSGPNPAHTFVNTTTNNQIFNVRLIATSPFGCIDTTYGALTVFPKPTASLAPAISQGCQPLTVNFINASTGGTSYAWDFGDGATSTSPNASLSHIFSNVTGDTAFYEPELIVYTDDGCSDTAVSDIRVFRYVDADFAVPQVGCHPFTVQFSDSSDNPNTWAWNFGDGNTSSQQNPPHQYVNLGVAPVNYTAQLTIQTVEGCQASISKQVTVNHKPTAVISPTNQQGCQPLSVNFLNNSIAGDVFDWTFGDGATSASGNAQIPHVFVNPGNDTAFFTTRLIVLTDEGCRDTAFSEIDVYRYVHAQFTVPQVGCSPFSTQFTDQSTNANSWSWTFGDGNVSSLQSPLHVYTNNGLAPVNNVAQLTVQTVEGCQDDTSLIVTVNHKPNAAILPLSQQGCQPLTVNFANNSTGGTAYDWDFGDGATSNTAGPQTHVFINNTNTNVNYETSLEVTTAQGCKDTAIASIGVYRKILADFSVIAPGCHPFNAQFTDASLNAVSWDWDFDDGSTSAQTSPGHQFINTTLIPDTFDVVLTVENLEGCPHDTSVSVVVFPKPTSIFQIDDSPACSGESVTINNSSILNTQNTWKFSNSGFPFVNNQAVIDTSFTNLSSVTNTFSITLVVENEFGCTDTSSKQMKVYPYVNAAFISFDEGCAPFELKFTNQSVGSGLFHWDFGDGNISFLEEPTYTYENNVGTDTTYRVVLTSTSPFGCESRDSIDILIHPKPNPVFIVNPTAQRYPDTVFSITNLTPGGPWNHDWTFGDGLTMTTQQPLTHGYSTWGTYQIVLRSYSDYCEDTASRTVLLEPPLPIADMNVSADECAPVTVNFDHASEYGVNYFWEFGDGATSSSEFPSYTYQAPGTYTVKLTVTGPGGDVDMVEIQDAVVVRTQPVANFVYTPQEVAIPAPVTFVNYSQFADDYLWDFGDSTTSVESNPQKVYLKGGQYYPFLIASTTFGCADTFYSDLPINAVEVGQLEIPNAFTPNSDGSNGGFYDPLAFNNQIFFPVLTGVASDEYTLSIFNRWGELIFETHDVMQGWDGYYRDRLCTQDVYVWKMKGEYINGEKFSKVGDVTLIQ